MAKTVFIGHPISGDVTRNIQSVLAICRLVHTPNIIPVAPYLVSLQYLDDTVVEDCRLGIEANCECFHRGYVDELWLYGNQISPGMHEEIRLARRLGIPVFAKTTHTALALRKLAP